MSQVLHDSASDFADAPHSTASGQPVAGLTVADLFERYGPLPLSRIRFFPGAGTATEADVLRLHERHDRLFELEDGILVEKTVGFNESALAFLLGRLVGNFVADRDLGRMFGADGIVRLAAGLLRIPDVGFVSWQRLPNRHSPSAVLEVAPDLAIEVISPSNTRQEMNRKLTDYFAAGVRLVWYVYPLTREVHVYTAVDRCVVVGVDGTLDGGDVLPGFSLQVAQIFK